MLTASRRARSNLGFLGLGQCELTRYWQQFKPALRRLNFARYSARSVSQHRDSLGIVPREMQQCGDFRLSLRYVYRGELHAEHSQFLGFADNLFVNFCGFHHADFILFPTLNVSSQPSGISGLSTRGLALDAIPADLARNPVTVSIRSTFGLR